MSADAQRIRSNAVPNDDGCWIWRGYLDPEGYGKATLGGRSMGAHRASYVAHIGPIPSGMTVDHLCFQPACVNPDHMRLLTRQENSRTRDPNKKPPWEYEWPRQRGPRRPLSTQILPPDAPVIDFEEAS